MAPRSLRLALVSLVLALAGCPSGLAPPPDAGRDGGLDAFDPSFDANVARFDAPLGPDAGEVCGDGLRTLTEACDDGDLEPGDGCSPSCEVEPGFRCLPAMPCRPIVCGDRLVEAPERCDDGNADAGDGCSDGCEVESGWTCAVAGVACRAAMCGDGLVRGFEQCDDGDTTTGDGCDDQCLLEPGFACPSEGADCRPTTCGDGTPEGREQCDDGNRRAFDGCGPDCVREPACAGGTCTAICGDGVILPGTGETCDDGNTTSGDGCSASCAEEEGFTCTLVTPPAPDRLVLPVVYRDFRGVTQSGSPTHPDFDARGGTGITFSMTGTRLDAEGRPTFSGTVVGGAGALDADSFRDWYRDSSRNVPILGTLTLDRVGATSAYTYDSGAFFPIDGRGWTEPGAIGESYPDALPAVHNYSFSTEIHTWFVYGGTERLDFRGDDDVWVFVDGQLCLDVGGLHPPESAVMDFASPAAAGDARQVAIVTACRDRLVAGRVYELVVFHAERRCCGSNFRLTLSGFAASTSRCDDRCGDGIVTRFELCDDGEGMNTGEYGRCGTDCLSRGPYCGDGTRDEGFEACDDGLEDNDGRYGGCNPDCTLGPYCGDGVRQGSEECDAAEDNGLEGGACSASCTLTLA
jgi:fibro-slime domain-containing protein